MSEPERDLIEPTVAMARPEDEVEPFDEPARPLFTLRADVLAWLGLSAAFMLLRLGTIWHASVGGPELDGLSGAWQARVGVADERFIPTLFQAIVALLLHWSDSEIPGRILAFLATATIPGAIYCLRVRLGEAGALLALIFLALDGPGIALGTSASAMGFDLALVTWLAVAIERRTLPTWAWAVAAFLLVTAGPLPLLLLLGWGAVTLARREYPRPEIAVWAGVGVVAGVLAATFQFGLGLDGGLRVPPLDLFAASFDRPWATASTLEIAVLYVLPIVVAGIASAAAILVHRVRDGDYETFELTLLAWAGIALSWFIFSAASESPVPVTSLTLPLAILAGPGVVRAWQAMLDADWRNARYLVPLALFVALVAVSFMLDWARNDKAGDSTEKTIVALLLVLAVLSLGLVAWNRQASPSLLVPALVVGAFPFVSGGLGIAFSSAGEPLPSPVSTQQARELRSNALQLARENDGLIVVHPDFREEMTWSFRDSGDIILASRAPADAAVLVWPADAPRPDGFNSLDGEWSFLRKPVPPTANWLQYLRWFTNRNVLAHTQDPVVVYVKARQ